MSVPSLTSSSFRFLPYIYICILISALKDLSGKPNAWPWPYPHTGCGTCGLRPRGAPHPVPPVAAAAQAALRWHLLGPVLCQTVPDCPCVQRPMLCVCCWPQSAPQLGQPWTGLLLPKGARFRAGPAPNCGTFWAGSAEPGFLRKSRDLSLAPTRDPSRAWVKPQAFLASVSPRSQPYHMAFTPLCAPSARGSCSASVQPNLLDLLMLVSQGGGCGVGLCLLLMEKLRGHFRDMCRHRQRKQPEQQPGRGQAPWRVSLSC